MILVDNSSRIGNNLLIPHPGKAYKMGKHTTMSKDLEIRALGNLFHCLEILLVLPNLRRPHILAAFPKNDS